MLSATLHSPEIRKASDILCQNPIWIDLKGKDYVPDRVNDDLSYYYIIGSTMCLLC